ncbi:MAG: hypothetical protein ACOXZS_01645 [Bacilli bacterium]
MKNTTKRSKSKYTEDWLPVESISNGMIILSNKEMVTGVKIMPRNIFILDEESQQNILINLKNFYNMLDFEFWIVVADRPVDVALYLSKLQLLYNDTQNPAIRKLINQDIQKANMFVNNNVADTEYYLLFKERNTDVIQKRIRILINGLASAGLNASQTNNDDLRTIIDSFLSGGETANFGAVMPV